MPYRSLLVTAMLVAASPVVSLSAIAAPAAGGAAVIQAPAPDFGKLLQSARAGDVQAQDALGQYYFEGRGGAPDYVEAFKWSEKAAKKEVATSLVRLGILYASGLGVEEADSEKAFKHLRRGAIKGDIEGMLLVGMAFRAGDGVEASDTEAFKWVKRAALRGHARGQFHLGSMYKEGAGVESDMKQAEAWLTKAAEQGVPEAFSVLGDLYEADDEAKSIAWNRKAAQAGHLPSTGYVGLQLALTDKPAQQQEGLTWLRKAAERGDGEATAALAKYLVGVCPHSSYRHHPDNECLPKKAARNEQEGMKLMLAEAEAGNSLVFYPLARLYAQGRGVAKDPAKAYHWYGRAAISDQYASEALTEIVKGLAAGQFAQNRPQEAVGWYQRALNGNSQLARLQLATAYEQGKGIGKDPVEAAFYYSVAARATDDAHAKPAAAGLKRVLATLTSAQRTALRERFLGHTFRYY
jgi:TPR repeat protein